MESDHLVVSNFDFEQHIWLTLPQVDCDDARGFFPAWPDFELFDGDVSAVDSLGFEGLF